MILRQVPTTKLRAMGLGTRLKTKACKGCGTDRTYLHVQWAIM